MKLENQLAVPFAIAQDIHSYFSEVPSQNKACVTFSENFDQGINPYLHQTETGLALMTDPDGTKIVTKFGSWSILDKPINEFKVFENIQIHLGLKLKESSKISSIWEITTHNNQKIESLSFKKPENFLSAKTVQKVFNDFIFTDTLMQSHKIAQKVQSFVTEKSYERGDKPWASYSGVYREGPYDQYNQTTRGFALVTHGHIPVMLHSKCGLWNIIGSAQADIRFKEILTQLKELFGLEKLKEKDGYTTWKITKFDDEKIEELSYKEEKEYTLSERIKFAFKIFKKKNKGPWSELKSKL